MAVYERTNCRTPESVDDLKEGFVFQKRGNIRIDREQAKKFTQNEYNSLDDVEVCDIETADNGSQEFYHASPDGARDSIETEGLVPTGAEMCDDGEGVFVTERQDEAEGWARTLGAERSREAFDIWRIATDDSVDVRDDTRPINPRNVPDSEVICTSAGIPPSDIEHVKRMSVDLSDRSEMGGFI